MPEDTISETPAQETANDVVMRFLTQGGATVELHHQDKRVRTLPGSSVQVMPNGETRISHGFNWRCLGCGDIGGGGRYGLGDRHFDRFQKDEARNEANQHATTCRAMPKPTAA
ncbi:hypothetical protein ACFZAR_36095 [Streptomyces sp. NPDC008222]|uniref:hypothetical protein n=1 Tax=Streptomyces sp. NPDC008222 TaxID=3364820 RepID=UPI0036EDA82E